MNLLLTLDLHKRTLQYWLCLKTLQFFYKMLAILPWIVEKLHNFSTLTHGASGQRKYTTWRSEISREIKSKRERRQVARENVPMNENKFFAADMRDSSVELRWKHLWKYIITMLESWFFSSISSRFMIEVLRSRIRFWLLREFWLTLSVRWEQWSCRRPNWVHPLYYLIRTSSAIETRWKSLKWKFKLLSSFNAMCRPPWSCNFAFSWNFSCVKTFFIWEFLTAKLSNSAAKFSDLDSSSFLIFCYDFAIA